MKRRTTKEQKMFSFSAFLARPTGKKKEICFITKFLIEKSSIKSKYIIFPIYTHFKIMSKVSPVFWCWFWMIDEDALAEGGREVSLARVEKFVSNESMWW